jgi:hypothetical protein
MLRKLAVVIGTIAAALSFAAAASATTGPQHHYQQGTQCHSSQDHKHGKDACACVILLKGHHHIVLNCKQSHGQTWGNQGNGKGQQGGKGNGYPKGGYPLPQPTWTQSPGPGCIPVGFTATVGSNGSTLTEGTHGPVLTSGEEVAIGGTDYTVTLGTPATTFTLALAAPPHTPFTAPKTTVEDLATVCQDNGYGHQHDH